MEKFIKSRFRLSLNPKDELLTRNRVSKRVTHVVASSQKTRTQKVREAAKFPHIKIVTQQWLIQSMSKWKRDDESEYLVSRTPLMQFIVELGINGQIRLISTQQIENSVLMPTYLLQQMIARNHQIILKVILMMRI